MREGLEAPASTEDPPAGRGRIRTEGDEDLEALGNLLAALAASFGATLFATAEVAGRAAADSSLHTALEEAGAVNKKTGHVTAQAIGYRFRAAQDRIVRSLKLVSTRSDKHANRRLWCIEPCGDGGDGGNGGDASSLPPEKR